MKIKFSGIIIAGVLLFSSPFSNALVLAQDPGIQQNKFIDISEHWSKDAVYKLLEKGAIPFEQGEFSPDTEIKKSEFAAMLHNALEIQISYFAEPNIKDYYNDISQDAPYAMNVIDLVSADVFEGNGSFEPEGTLAREEMVHYIMRAYKFEMGDRYAMININPATFTDVDDISPEYGGEVARAQHYNLINGNENNMFEPKKAATRAETAVAISRLVDFLEEQDVEVGQNQGVTVEPSAIAKDDSIEMKINIKNNTQKDVSINFTSGQKYDFELLDADRNSLYRWSADKMFTQELSTLTIKAGDTLEFSDTLSGDAYNAIKDRVVYFKAYVTGTSDFINSNGYEIKIK